MGKTYTVDGFQMKKVKSLVELKDICKVSLYHPNGIPEEIEQRMKEEWSDRMDIGIIFEDPYACGGYSIYEEI